MADNRRSGDVYTDYLLTGQKQDDTRLLYYWARYYDKLLGAFISPGPVIPDAENVFAYNQRVSCCCTVHCRLVTGKE